jgi:hypothetical protein
VVLLRLLPCQFGRSLNTLVFLCVCISTATPCSLPSLSHPVCPNSDFSLSETDLRSTVTPLFLFTDVRLGGLGFSPLQISLFIGGSGLLQAITVLFIFPPLHKRLGTKTILKSCGVIWPISFALWPLCNVLVKNNQQVLFWILIVLNNIIGSGASIAFSKSKACLLLQ